MSIYDSVRVDNAVEQKGVVLEYGKFRVTVARAGGGNKKYAAVLEAKSRPYRRAIQTETIAPDVAQRVLREVYVEAVIQKWEINRGTEENPDWVAGVDIDAEGNVVPATKENILKTLSDPTLNWLFDDLQAQATQVALFRAAVQEAAAGN